MAIDVTLWRAARKLCRDLESIQPVAPVTHVYNPLEYASRPHREYLRKYGASKKRVVYLGMNPGPYGMAQTGVPFGTIRWVRDWMGIEKPVAKPELEHPKRPIQGFACERKEISGDRVWGAISDHYGKPEKFFKSAFITNYCPLVFMEESGKNRTPDKLNKKQQGIIQEACDHHLRSVIKTLSPEWVIGIGKFAEGKAASALEGMDVKIGTVLHPSPASPIANRGWAPQASLQIRAMGLCK
ncbi:MAG: single-stranded DNA-binding protein [Polyangiaceae bacterium]|nr:single-stranded DNA-binding protein [Polyangiaceae bacterium]